jgi:tetratricopeptide (TPR) repeat protein
MDIIPDMAVEKIESPIITATREYIRQGEYEKAQEYCDEMMKVNPANLDVHRAMAMLYQKLENHGDAEQEMIKALEKAMKQSRPEQIISLYEEFQDMNPHTKPSTEALYRVGMAYSRIERHGGASRLLRGVITTKGVEGKWKALSLFQLGKIERDVYHEKESARQYFQQFVDEFPTHEWVGIAKDFLAAD